MHFALSYQYIAEHSSSFLNRSQASLKPHHRSVVRLWKHPQTVPSHPIPLLWKGSFWRVETTLAHPKRSIPLSWISYCSVLPESSHNKTTTFFFLFAGHISKKRLQLSSCLYEGTFDPLWLDTPIWRQCALQTLQCHSALCERSRMFRVVWCNVVYSLYMLLLLSNLYVVRCSSDFACWCVLVVLKPFSHLWTIWISLIRLVLLHVFWVTNMFLLLKNK